jgi:hypothetical protein|tara:strand:- start:3132 stop:3464 length:333 start_codon:yes stop_codon:yes gene_type:complete
LKFNQNLIESICGVKPPNIEIIDVGNDPNYVFLKDQSFTPIRLYDIEGNIAIVNSWVECAHYFNGGWTTNFQQIIPGDKYIALITASAIAVYYFFNLYSSNKIRKNFING